jgi:opacity protein-like surface antigen
MIKKTMLAGAALVAGVFSAQAYDAGKYDSTSGFAVEGIYGISTKDVAPNLGGVNLSLFNYINSGAVINQISLNVGILAGDHHPGIETLGYDPQPFSLRVRTTYVPMMAGYTMNFRLADSVLFYLGGKIGATYGNANLKGYSKETKTSYRQHVSDTRFSWAVQSGFKFGVNDNTDIVLGYEYYRIQKFDYLNPSYHCIKLGVFWNF